MTPTINADRLWQSIMAIARIGPTSDGGSNRMALTPEDAAARALFLDWCKAADLAFEQDAIGNMFLRRAGTDPAALAVAFGSHLDTVPTGGRFDGVFGVLAGLEVMRTLHDAGLRTRAPLELVNWTNEEGSRFRPAMMGSRVHAGDMTLEAALGITDDHGVSVAQALRDSGQAGALTPSPRGWACWLEAHIEQGPVMEATNSDIGIVTGTMHARYFQLDGDRRAQPCRPHHDGAPARQPGRGGRGHPGGSSASRLAAEPHGRASATWIENFPNARGNVANVTRLHCDVRHETAARAIAMEADVARRARCDRRASPGADRRSIPTRPSDRCCSTRRCATCCATRPRIANCPRAT